MKDKSKQHTMTEDQMHNAFKTILTATKVSYGEGESGSGQPVVGDG